MVAVVWATDPAYIITYKTMIFPGLPTNPPEFYDNNERYQKLYDHMKKAHGLTLDVGEMEEIAAICEELPKSYAEENLERELAKVRAERDTLRVNVEDLSGSTGELGSTILRLAKERDNAIRYHKLAAEVAKGVWATHEKQFAEQAETIDRLRTELARTDSARPSR